MTTLSVKGSEKNEREPPLYVKTQGNNHKLIISLYVGDHIYTEINEYMIYEFKEDMMKSFEMTDLC